MDAEKKRLRDEVAELAEAVRALRVELAIAQAAHHCHCVHPVWVVPNASPLPYQPLRVWCGAVTSGTVTSGGYTVTNALSQGN
jgi:hypothetical protein